MQSAVIAGWAGFGGLRKAINESIQFIIIGKGRYVKVFWLGGIREAASFWEAAGSVSVTYTAIRELFFEGIDLGLGEVVISQIKLLKLCKLA